MRTVLNRAAAARRSLSVTGIGAAVAVSVLAGTLVSGAQAQTFTPREENPEEFPAGKGRDETFYSCTACHGFKLVAQQGLNRRQWEDSLNLMTTKHGMPKLDDADRKTVLDYLEATFPPRAPAGRGSPNPFLK